LTDIVVTGIGLITALGDSVDSNRQALMHEKGGVTRLENVETVYANQKFFGEIKLKTDFLKDLLGAHELGVTRTSLLSLHAFQQAIRQAGLSAGEISDSKTALVSANTVGGMCLTNEIYTDANRYDEGSDYVNSYDNGASTLYLQNRYKMNGWCNTINTACSSSANSIMYGARLIKNGMAKKAIVGGVDSLAKFTINGFNALYILSPEPSTPFDENRQGLNLGEGAAYLVLEKAEDVPQEKVIARLSGYCNRNDAFHPSALSDDGIGPFEAMNGALNMAGLNPSTISYVNAHGTGTENNDLAESRALMRLFGKVPDFSSTKAFTGHTLGAAGAVEAVFSIMALTNQEVYPNLNFKNPIPETGLTPILKYRKQEVKHAMSNSFGFAGNCSSLIFSAP
jgi:3-oxoacyl-(acyl-carrier-protein) synthase